MSTTVTKWFVVVATGLILTTGCSSSDGASSSGSTSSTTSADTTAADTTAADTTVPTAESGDPDPGVAGGVTLLDAGTEPRVPLALTGDARTRLGVDASDTLELTIDEVTTDDGGIARYDLDLDLTVSDSGAELLVVPSAVSVDGAALAADDLGTWKWILDRHGLVQRVVSIGRSDGVDAATVDLLNVSHLVLVTPIEPVGVGAMWSQSLDQQSDAELVFTLVGITDVDLEVTVELVAPFEAGVATMAASGTYDRATLLARALTTESNLEITSPVSDNGEMVELSGVQRSERIYTPVAETEVSG